MQWWAKWAAVTAHAGTFLYRPTFSASIVRRMMLPRREVQAALTTFDDTGSNEVDIEVVTQEVTRLFRKCEAQLQRFGEQRSSSEADEKVRARCGRVTLCRNAHRYVDASAALVMLCIIELVLHR